MVLICISHISGVQHPFLYLLVAVGLLWEKMFET